MRRLLVVVGLIASISNASAGEYPILRGSSNLVPDTPTYFNWSGFYVGGQVGYGTSGMDFADASQPLIAFSLRELALENVAHPSEWQVLGKANTKGGSAGAFVGYNTRFDDVVVGLDLNYSRTSYFAGAPFTPITRLTSAGGNTYLVTLTADASLRITDILSVRARAGYAVDNWLPFATIGLAVGRANYARTATASGQENPAAICPSAGPPPCTPFSFTESEAQSGVFVYGVSVSGGVDVMVMPQMFLRAEYEYVSFSKVGDIRATTGTGRLGVGFKF